MEEDTTATQKISLPAWSVPLALLVLAVLSFGLLAPKLGFYWDDWAKIYVNQWQGSSGFWQYYLDDRPLSAWTHVVLTPLLGSSTLKWQIFGVVIRWLTASAFWWVLILLWPKAKKHSAFAAALFLVYPLFTMQPLAVTFHQQWLQYFFYFVSLSCMLLAVRELKPVRWAYLALSVLTMLAHLSITEYFIGVELLRPIFLWVVCTEQSSRKQKILSVLKWWLPFALITVAFIVYRLFLIQLPGEDPNQVVLLDALRTAPKAALIDFAKSVFSDTVYILVTQWQRILDIGVKEIFPLFPHAIKLAWLAGGLTLAGFAFYWLWLKKDGAAFRPAHPHWVRQMLVIGVLGVLLGCLPAWVAGRSVWGDAHSSRYALPALFGASMIWVALLTWAIPRRLPRALSMAVLLGLVVIFQVRNGAVYQKIWENQTAFYWQLYWRAPALEKGTAILSQQELFPDQGSFAISSALNILYHGYPQAGENTPYWFYALSPRFEGSVDHPTDIPLHTQFRTFLFEGQTPDSLIVYYDPGRMNCMWVLGPDDADNPYLPSLTKAMLPASNLQRILTQTGAGPEQEIFGAEPQHDWCYFYQKAALASQNQDWPTVVQLADQARSDYGYHPADGYFKTMQEWLVFLKGYAYAGELDKAAELTQQIVERDDGTIPQVCRIWSTLDGLSSTVGDEADLARDAMIEQLHCEVFLVK